MGPRAVGFGVWGRYNAGSIWGELGDRVVSNVSNVSVVSDVADPRVQLEQSLEGIHACYETYRCLAEFWSSR